MTQPLSTAELAEVYLGEVSDLLQQIKTGSDQAVDAAAELLAEQIASDRLVHILVRVGIRTSRVKRSSFVLAA